MAKQNLGRVAMVSKGEYSSATNYERLDIVTYQGSSYVCKKDSIGNLPTNTEYFDILAEKGANGEDGQDGYTPEKGKDYWNEQDKQEMKEDVIEDITPTLNLKQNITDNTLQTTNKTVPTAINEVNLKTSNNASDIDTIEEKIPTQATASNQLADKDFVNSSINSITAFYITKNANGDQFSTKAELDAATVFYSGGEVRVPTRNDYCVVLADETKTDATTGENPTTRYIYNNGWEYQYTVNKTSLTAQQLAAINSGITSALVGQISTNQTNISGIKDGTSIDSFSDVESALSDKVGFTDYASTSKAGAIKTGNGLNVSSGTAIGVSRTYAQYSSDSNNYIMSKGTIENVWNERTQTISESDYEALATKDSSVLYLIPEE